MNGKNIKLNNQIECYINDMNIYNNYFTFVFCILTIFNGIVNKRVDIFNTNKYLKINQHLQ